MKLFVTHNKQFYWIRDNEEHFCRNVYETLKFGKLLGIKSNEIEIAITEIEKNGHNLAHFGDINRMFLFTKNHDS